MSPREVHLEVLYFIFHFMWNNPNKRQVIEPSNTTIDESVFHSNANWVEFYGNVAEEDPPQMSEPLGDPVLRYTFFYSDHTSNVVTRRSHTGIILFVFSGIIKDFSKQQNTVKSSTFGSELVALRIARDLIVELRIKLKSVGVPLKGPTGVY